MDKEIFKTLEADAAKIFALDIIEAYFAVENFFEQFRRKLSVLISELIQNDYTRLLNLLYRVDVDENVVTNCLQGSNISNVADSLADAVIARLIKKIKYRTEHKREI